jgi:hypothetical protein
MESVEQLVDMLAVALDCRVVDEEDTYRFIIGSHMSTPIAKSDLERIRQDIAEFYDLDGVAVLFNGSYEVLLLQNSIPMRRSEEFVLEDTKNGIKYILGPPSKSYLICILERLANTVDLEGIRKNRPTSRVLFRTRYLNDQGEWDLFSFLRSVLGAYDSLTIVSTENLPQGSWQRYADAYFFQLGYNLDSAVIRYRYLDDLVRPARISTLRRSSRKDLDVPRRFYISDLVHHYHLGVSAESPMLEFLSYYHVAEHFFENIYQDDLVMQVQETLTSPGFSYRRKKDIQGLIKKVSRAVQVRDEQFVVNEQVALRLTLERYVNIDQLVGDLNSFDPELLDRYASQVVEFSGGDAVTLNSADVASRIAALSKRIYKTRNALVHSKDGAKSRFVPFEHDKQLLDEVPLVRFIAEQIIIATSTLPS